MPSHLKITSKVFKFPSSIPHCVITYFYIFVHSIYDIMKFTSNAISSISRAAVSNPFLKFILCFFLGMNEVNYLLQYGKYLNYPKFTWGQLQMFEIGVHQYAPVTLPAWKGELAKELNRRKTKIVVVFTIVALVHDRI